MKQTKGALSRCGDNPTYAMMTPGRPDDFARYAGLSDAPVT